MHPWQMKAVVLNLTANDLTVAADITIIYTGVDVIAGNEDSTNKGCTWISCYSCYI